MQHWCLRTRSLFHDKFRMITLDASTLKWYLCVLSLLLDPYFNSAVWLLVQAGGCQGGQVSDIVFILRLIVHNFHVWPLEDNLILIKLDIRRAFDRVFISVVIAMLEFLCVPKWLSLAYIKTLWGGMMRPFINGQSGPDVECHRGLRQGRVDSMRTFCTLLCFIFQSVLQQWHQRGFGFPVGTSRVCMVSYADDCVLVCRNMAQAEYM
eukprot:11119647-Karenia_brevis.AAC.1